MSKVMTYSKDGFEISIEKNEGVHEVILNDPKGGKVIFKCTSFTLASKLFDQLVGNETSRKYIATGTKN